MHEIQIELAKELFLTAIVLVAGGVALYQIISVSKKHTVHNVAIVIYGMFFLFMVIRLIVHYIIAYFSI